MSHTLRASLNGLRGWEPPRGAASPAGGKWPPLLARDLQPLGKTERFVVNQHRLLLTHLVQARYELKLSRQAVADLAGVHLSSIRDAEAGNYWPSYQVMGGWAEAVGYHLVTVPTVTGKLIPHSRANPEMAFEVAANASDVAERVRAYHDVSCVLLSQTRTSMGISVRALAEALDLSPATVNRVDRAPLTGEWVSYLALAVIGSLLGAPPVVIPWEPRTEGT